MEGKRQLQHNFSAVTGGGRVKKYDFNQAIPRAEKHKPQKRRLGQRNPGYFQEPPQRTALRGRHRAEPKRAVRRRRAALSGRYLLKNFTSFTQADGAPTPSLPSPGRLGGAGEPSPGSEPASQPASQPGNFSRSRPKTRSNFSGAARRDPAGVPRSPPPPPIKPPPPPPPPGGPTRSLPRRRAGRTSSQPGSPHRARRGPLREAGSSAEPAPRASPGGRRGGAGRSRGRSA